MEFLKLARWSPYIVGAGIGVLSWFTLLISKKFLGCSTTFARTSGMIEKLLRGKPVEEKDYYKKIGLKINWQWMMVLGILFGSLAAALLSGGLEWSWVPAVWAASFGAGVPGRVLGALVGGVLIGFGSRWANGCTSGHGISGTMQLTVSSWISAICFFIGGIATAFALFGLGG